MVVGDGGAAAVSSKAACGRSHDVTETIMALFGMQNKTFGPYLAVMHRIPSYEGPASIGMQRQTFGPYLAVMHRILIAVMRARQA
jgi:hypothetical protein